MATRAVAGAALAAVAMIAGVACSSDDDAPDAATVAIPEVGLSVDVPGHLADLTYAMGEAEEGQPAVYFSSQELVSVGGTACEAGATASVSPYPLGQIVVADETPDDVREEFKDNPEESIGKFLTKVSADEYVYYSAPPDEPCYDDPDVAALQNRLTADLKVALSSLAKSD